MNAKKKVIAACVLLSAAFPMGCGGSSGEPPEVLVDGVSVIVGESKPSDLEEQNFEINDMGAMIQTMPEKSWTSAVYLEKDGISYASLVLTNDSNTDKAVGDCCIEEIGFYSLNEEGRDLNIMIDGINPIGMTQDELKEAYPGLELDDEEGDYLFHYLNDGEYSVCFEYCYGELTDIDVTHSFNKSYDTK